jgi:putative hydrolase of the HAD superfamily
MPIRAVTFDAYGTLLRNEDLTAIPRRIVADHGLSVSPDEILRRWVDLYHEATQLVPFRTLRQMEGHNLSRLLGQLGLVADPAPYVELFFEVTTKVEPYPEALEVLNALGPVRSAIVSNADHEHVAAWPFKWPVQFVLVSEAVQAYKPNPLVFRRALEQLGLPPHEVLHVGDSDIDDVGGARAAGLRVAWLNRTGRPRRPQVPAPDHEIRDLRELLPLL